MNHNGSREQEDGYAVGWIRGVCIDRQRKARAERVHVCTAVVQGLEGDVHCGRGERQVSLLPAEQTAAWFRGRQEEIRFGWFGENLTVEGLDWGSMREGRRLRSGDVLLEIVKVGAGGPASDAYQGEKVCAPMEKWFVFCRILTPGILREDTQIGWETTEE